MRSMKNKDLSAKYSGLRTYGDSGAFLAVGGRFVQSKKSILTKRRPGRGLGVPSATGWSLVRHWLVRHWLALSWGVCRGARSGERKMSKSILPPLEAGTRCASAIRE